MIDRELLAILACPRCKGPVKADEEGLICEKCRLFYEVKDGIPIMLIDEARSLDDRGDAGVAAQISGEETALAASFPVSVNDADNDYFAMLEAIFARRMGRQLQDAVYRKIGREIAANAAPPVRQISFGTSGWRGILGKDITVKTVVQVTRAIIRLYEELETEAAGELRPLLGISSLDEAKKRGCVIGFDNRFAGELLAVQVAKTLVEAGFTVFYAGETTTGVLSAVVLQQQQAFSINLTPSHNPFQYGGYKFNAADGGPAASEVTAKITRYARELVASEKKASVPELWHLAEMLEHPQVQAIDSFSCWQAQLACGEAQHGLSLERITAAARQCPDLFLAVDCVHGASRLHIRRLYGGEQGEQGNLEILRSDADVTFGGVAPEPSGDNMREMVALLEKRAEKLKIGAIIDPDGDRIRFTDGETEISMNQFGAMAYHFLHETVGKRGIVAKTVATSNLANALAAAFGEEVFEPAVGFKNFKPVMGRALVFFEESDGISVLGHTAEKDAYIGLLLALAITLETGQSLGAYLRQIEEQYGVYFPVRDGIEVSLYGDELKARLAALDQFSIGTVVPVGETGKKIVEVITLDGWKMIFDDGSWLMIRPSGTEPKVRFYVESRTAAGTKDLMLAARKMLVDVGVITP